MNGRYRPDSSEDEFYAGYGGSAGVSFDMWQGARFTGNQSIGFQPYFTLDLAPSLDAPGLGQPVVDDPAFAGVIGEDNRYYSSQLALSQRVSRRGSLGFTYHRQVSDFASATSDYTSSGGGAGYTHTISKGLSLRAGYGYSESSSDSEGAVEPVRVHSIDAGVNFNRALSFSKRTTLSFSTGSSGVADASGTRYYITGGAQLQRELGRTWAAAAGYSRNVQFVDAVRRPVLSDGATLSFGGLINRRLQFNSSASVSFAHSTTGEGDEFDTYLAAAGLSYALTRYVSLDVNYTFYRYKFAETAVVPPGFDPETKRQAIRGTVSLWAPIFQRARRPDAAR
jgi:opacity protein-like surface antigen